MNFPRSHRLATQQDYKSVFDQSNKVSRREFLVLFKQNQKSHARLGLVIGKRYLKRAVDRNKTKRILRESFRQYQEKLIGFDVIVIAKQQGKNTTKQKLREGIDQLWEKLLTHS